MVNVDILIDPTAADCLHDGPLMTSARSAVEAAGRLGTSAAAAQLRAWAVPFMFDAAERAFGSGLKPTPAIAAALESLRDAFDGASRAGLARLGDVTAEDPDADVPRSAEAVAGVTGAHYGRLFSAFSSGSFWSEPARLLRERLDRNGIERERWEGKHTLDAGCGGGRYTVAWRLHGARPVVGVDVSESGIRNARERVAAAGIDGVGFEFGDVLRLPFPDGAFDVVFSNGVLHHTTDWTTGIRELVRVLRPGGLGWLYLIERPGGLFWDVIEVLRAIMAGQDRPRAQRALQALGLPANRIFYMLDHVMVPINLRLTADEVEQALASAGACRIRRLTRGADFDRVEAIHRGDPYAVEKFGAGENRYVFSRD